MNRKQLAGIIEITLGSLGFGFLGIFGKWAFASGLGVGELLTYRFIIAALLLWAGLFIFSRDKIIIPRAQLVISACLGILGYAVFATLYFTAIKGMSVGLAALLLYTYPFWVSLLGHFFLKERMNQTQWLLLLGAFIGVSCLLWGQFHISNMTALIAGLGSALTYAAYILFSARYQRSVKPISSSLYVITFAAIALAVFHQPNLQMWNVLSTYQWQVVLAIASISTILPMTLILAGLQKLKSSQAALITMLEPVTAAIAAGIFLHESMSTLQIIGATIVITCLALSILKPGK
ncbi:DMT family transporter [Bdellovibrio sp. HCB337]|uniref:DMT family transporter n=1 Tax=Bdellovibrio sp. HCB337 TaxID=3394358 RepID=UPI0039A61230